MRQLVLALLFALPLAAQAADCPRRKIDSIRERETIYLSAELAGCKPEEIFTCTNPNGQLFVTGTVYSKTLKSVSLTVECKIVYKIYPKDKSKAAGNPLPKEFDVKPQKARSPEPPPASFEERFTGGPEGDPEGDPDDAEHQDVNL